MPYLIWFEPGGGTPQHWVERSKRLALARARAIARDLRENGVKMTLIRAIPRLVPPTFMPGRKVDGYIVESRVASWFGARSDEVVSIEVYKVKRANRP